MIVMMDMMVMEDLDGGMIIIIWEDVNMMTMTTPLDGVFTQEEVGTMNPRLLDIKIPIQVVETTDKGVQDGTTCVMYSSFNCIQSISDQDGQMKTVERKCILVIPS